MNKCLPIDIKQITLFWKVHPIFDLQCSQNFLYCTSVQEELMWGRGWCQSACPVWFNPFLPWTVSALLTENANRLSPLVTLSAPPVHNITEIDSLMNGPKMANNLPLERAHKIAYKMQFFEIVVVWVDFFLCLGITLSTLQLIVH